MGVDAPSDADIFQTKLRDGDIVVAYVCMFARHLGIEHTNRPLSSRQMGFQIMSFHLRWQPFAV